MTKPKAGVPRMPRIPRIWKRVALLTPAVLAGAVFAGVVLNPGSGSAQGVGQQPSGWLEGTVTTAEGRVVANPYNFGPGGVSIRGLRQGGGEFNVASDKNLGGLFIAKNIKPGVYEVTVTNGYVNSVTKMRPQRIHGVLVKPGVRTVLNVTMEPGETLEETGKPVIAAEPAIIVSDELARLRREIEAVKAQ